MSAFGKKGGAGGMKAGGRPAFGVARPMKSGKPSGDDDKGGEQFPPLPGHGEKAESKAPPPSRP